ncbi:hypothetical protein [Kocuria rosea]|uniref:hypothetical protein n=1 Tax=Kocuria rosea TaxID=1275 RepID=UPI000F83FD15|nr:hypothetical protein [Kocuria rosea]
MHRPFRLAVPSMTVTSILLLGGCGTAPHVRDDTPLTDVDRKYVIAERGLPERYEQPEVAGAERSMQGSAIITVSDTPTGEDFRRAGTGLSFESTELADERLSADNSDLVSLVGSLERPTLRFGGNSVDRRFFFTAEDESPPTDWPLQPGEKITTVTADDLRRVAGFADAVDAEVILSANLATDDPARAAALAAHAHDAFGEDLVAIMVGNEPNGFHQGDGHRLSVKDENWDKAQYVSQLEEYTALIREKVPHLPVTAPGAFAPDWWEAVAQANLDHSVLAVHQYPLSSCAGSTPRQLPTMDNLVAPYTRANVDRFLSIAMDQGREAGMPVWLTETSVSACLGSNEITETLGSAIFAAEYSMRAQSLGVERLVHHSSLHQCAGGPPMSPVCSSGTRGDQGQAFVPRANHLGLVLVGQIPDGDFLDTKIAGNDDITAYAIRHRRDYRGQQDTTLVVTNFTDPGDAGRTPVRIDLPDAYGEAVMTQLGGPAWEASFPGESAFDVEPEAGSPRTEDSDGRAQTLGNALDPVGAENVSVDGWGLPLTPVEHRPDVPGARHGEDKLSMSLNPGTVTVLTLSQF